MSGPPDGPRAALRVTYDRDAYLTGVTLTTASVVGAASRVQVTHRAGRQRGRGARGGRAPDASRCHPATPAGWRSGTRSEDGEQLSVAELEVAGHAVTRWLRPPEVPEAWGAPDAISLDALTDPRSGCVEILAAVRCAPNRGPLGGEEIAGMRRILRIPDAADYTVRLRARPPSRRGRALAAPGRSVRPGRGLLARELRRVGRERARRDRRRPRHHLDLGGHRPRPLPRPELAGEAAWCRVCTWRSSPGPPRGARSASPSPTPAAARRSRSTRTARA